RAALDQRSGRPHGRRDARPPRDDGRELARPARRPAPGTRRAPDRHARRPRPARPAPVRAAGRVGRRGNLSAPGTSAHIGTRSPDGDTPPGARTAWRGSGGGGAGPVAFTPSAAPVS